MKTDNEAEREICRAEIIEIGAVAIDDSFEEIGTFKRYIKPVYSEHVSLNIRELTGIGDGFLYGCNPLEAEIDAFAAWCDSFGDDFTVYA